MSSPERSRARPATDRSGFTFIELLVALVISGIVVTSLFQLIMGQGRFVELQSAKEEVQQNSRAALELIGSELRTVPAGASLVMASSDSITVHAPRIWGVVCQVNGANSLDVAFPAVAGVSYAVNAGAGVVVNLGSAAQPLWSSAVGLTAVGGSSGSCAGGPLPTGVERRTLTLSSTPQNGAATPAPGHALYLYDLVTYRTGTSAGLPGLWIQRRIGPSGNQPLAGPIQEGTGLRFQYFAGASALPIATPITVPATRSTVDRIVVVVETVSRNSFGETRELRSDTIVVPLRNRT